MIWILAIVYMAFIFALIEIYYWEQEIGKKIKIFPSIGKFNIYWLCHPLLLLPICLMLFGLSWKVLGSLLFYGVFEDIFYFLVCYIGKTGNTYEKQDWMPTIRIFGFRLPIHYPVFILAGIVLFMV
jgi:hypothetical protein